MSSSYITTARRLTAEQRAQVERGASLSVFHNKRGELTDAAVDRFVAKEWIGFPAKSYEDKNGNTLWQPLVEFAEGAKEAREQFRKQALEAIHAAAREEVS